MMLQGRKVNSPEIFDGEAKIQQMSIITQADLDAMRQEHRRALREYGRNSRQAKRAFRLYKRMAYRKQMLDEEMLT